VPGLGLCVASMAAQAADGAPAWLPALPQGTGNLGLQPSACAPSWNLWL